MEPGEGQPHWPKGLLWDGPGHAPSPVGVWFGSFLGASVSEAPRAPTFLHPHVHPCMHRPPLWSRFLRGARASVGDDCLGYEDLTKLTLAKGEGTKVTIWENIMGPSL